MRLSVEPGDSGYDPRLVPLARVWLDGVEMPYVKMADEELGLILAYDAPLRDLSGEIPCSYYSGHVVIAAGEDPWKIRMSTSPDGTISVAAP